MTRLLLVIGVAALTAPPLNVHAQTCGLQRCIASTLVESGRKIRYTNNCDYSIKIMTARYCNGNNLHMAMGWGIPSGGYWDQDHSVSQCNPLGGNTLTTVIESACRDSPPPASPAPSPPPASPPPPPPPKGSAIQINNQCPNPMKFAFHYLDTDDKWQTDGMWQFASGRTAVLSSSGQQLRTFNPIVYVYAEEVGGGYKTNSARVFEFNGRKLPMDEVRFAHEDRLFKMSFNCPNLSGQGRDNSSVTNRGRGGRGN